MCQMREIETCNQVAINVVFTLCKVRFNANSDVDMSEPSGHKLTPGFLGLPWVMMCGLENATLMRYLKNECFWM